jgi:DNA recombination protein RmuC
MVDIVLWALLAVGLANVGLLAWMLSSRSRAQADEVAEQQARALAHKEILAALQSQTERVERELRREVQESTRAARQEAAQSMAHFQQSLLQQSSEAGRTQNMQIDAFGKQLALMQKMVSDSLARITESNAQRMQDVRQTLDAQLTQLQSSNAAKLDEMRLIVDEKLQTTLQARLGESFKQVAERLEQVHKGLGEMQSLAQGVGDLKHLLSNVKTRGMFGEAQLASLLEQVFVPDQYAAQVPTRPGSKHVVDFAIKLPGQGHRQAPLWLPIDAKFPSEDYERLLDAQARAHAVDAEQAARALEARIRLEAKSIGEKYLEPPHTTDFAILFLPTEGLYAEVLRRPGLMESLQRDYRITLAGPTTLLAMLNSLQMGFRTLALEKRSSEVWQVLGAVKNEFAKFGTVLAKVKSQTETVLKTLDSAEVRSRAMGRVLKQVEALPDEQAQALLPTDKDFDLDADHKL